MGGPTIISHVDLYGACPTLKITDSDAKTVVQYEDGTYEDLIRIADSIGRRQDGK